MGLQPILFLAFSLLTTVASPLRDVPLTTCSSTLQDEAHQLNSSGLHLTLHHPRSPCSPAAFPSSLPLSDVLSHDAARVRSLSARLTKKKKAQSPHRPAPKSSLLQPGAGNVPLTSGQSLGVGNYVSRISLGTPSKSYVVVVDTGSSLSWIQCSPCRISCHEQVGPVFDPDSSATYHLVPCSAAECDSLQSATLNPASCSASNVCIYQATYGDGSFSLGYLSKDTLSFGSGAALSGFVYGCGQDSEGLFGRSDGLVGLARNKLSLLSQLAPRFGNSFTYCLPTTSGTGYLSFGSYNPGQYSFTPLVSSSLDKSLYFLRLTGITVGGRGLAVSPSAYTVTPTIIDSGTVVTRLQSDVYNALSSAVAAALKGYSRKPAYSILDTCFKGSLRSLTMPAVSLVFQGGAELKLAPQNVMIDVDSSTTCLAFAPAREVAIIGNKQQQTFSVVYDISRATIGFAAGRCS